MTHPKDEIDLETPEADAAEQAMTVVPGQDDAGERGDIPEQDRIVEYDDDYR